MGSRADSEYCTRACASWGLLGPSSVHNSLCLEALVRSSQHLLHSPCHMLALSPTHSTMRRIYPNQISPSMSSTAKKPSTHMLAELEPLGDIPHPRRKPVAAISSLASKTPSSNQLLATDHHSLQNPGILSHRPREMAQVVTSLQGSKTPATEPECP